MRGIVCRCVALAVTIHFIAELEDVDVGAANGAVGLFGKGECAVEVCVLCHGHVESIGAVDVVEGVEVRWTHGEAEPVERVRVQYTCGFMT